MKVQRISSFSDPETGQLGKQIELVEVRQRGPQPTVFGFGDDESRLIKGILGHFQSLGLIPQSRQLLIPKLILYLTESEYELLGVRFEVNDVYELVLKDGSITLKRSLEGV